MTNKELQDLLKLINRLEISEFKMKEGDLSLSIRTKHYIPNTTSVAAPAAPMVSMPPQMAVAPAAPVAAPATPAPAAPAAAPAGQEDDESKYVAIKSPMVGTFYRSPSPDKPVYVKVGDSIGNGDTVCIIEAMKLFNEVEAEVSGKIVKVLVEDAQPVEYDQVLFLVDPS